MDIATATPAEIDGEIARIRTEIARHREARDHAFDLIERIDNAKGYDRDLPWFSPAKRAEANAIMVAATDRIALLRNEVAPLNARYDAERWTRFYLVTNTGGHVHWTTGCDTCFPTTSFAWLTEQSGMTHDALVEMAGEQACTVCFPNAPVDVLARKSRIETPDRKAARQEREAKAAAKAAAEVKVDGYVGYSSRVSTRTFKTVRAVTNDIAAHLGSLCWYGEGHPSAAEWTSNVAACRKALADKGVDYDYDKALAAARKKVTREGSTPKF